MDQFGGSWITESQIRNTDRFGGPLIPKSQLKIRIDFAVHGSLNPNLVIREILFFFAIVIRNFRNPFYNPEIN